MREWTAGWQHTSTRSWHAMTSSASWLVSHRLWDGMCMLKLHALQLYISIAADVDGGTVMVLWRRQAHSQVT